MFNTTRTIHNIALETAKQLGIHHYPLTGSTLNELYNIEVTTEETSPKLQYWGIGLRYNDVIESGSFTFANAIHTPDSRQLFKPVPFLLRKKSIGLTDAESNMYRMIVTETIDEEEYYACYLKKFDSSSPISGYYDVVFDGEHYDIDERSEVSKLDVPIKKVNLYPDDVKYNAYRHFIELRLTSSELNNVNSAIAKKYPDEDDEDGYIIGEICLYSGSEGVSSNRIESAVTQAAYFYNTDVILNDLMNGKSPVTIEQIDIGGMPLKYTNV